MRRLVAVVALVVAGCSGGVSADDCVDVSTSVVRNWGVGEPMSAVPAGEVLGRERFYFASSSGGVWVATVDPAGDGGGLVAPLNERARQLSELGVDGGSSGPLLDGVDAGSDGAEVAVSCAGG